MTRSTWSAGAGKAWALSLYQPWGHLVASGVKPTENRPWSTTFRGKFYIHAGLTPNLEACYVQAENATHTAFKTDHAKGTAIIRGWPSLHDIPRGGIIGSAELVDVVRPCARVDDETGRCTCKQPYHFGWQYGFVLRNAKLLPFVPLRGLQKFFRFDKSILKAQR